MRIPSIAGIGILLLTTSPVSAQEDAVTKVGAKLIDKNAGAVCTLNVVHELKFMGQTQEHRLVAHGTIVHESGLILASIGVVDPNVNVRGPRGRVNDVEVVPIEFKVVLGNEEEEREAFLVGKDSKLGFSFIQLKDGLPKDHKKNVVNFAEAKSPKVGERTLSILRLAKGYDYAPFLNVSRILGTMKKPRKAWILGGSSTTGLPVYNCAGELIGCNARIPSSLGDEDPGTGQLVVLRGGLVQSAIEQAVKQAKELAAEREKEGGEGGEKDN